MSWSFKWSGTATDLVPDLLKTEGNPGRLASAVRTAVFEAAQEIGQHTASACIEVFAQGWEGDDDHYSGQATIVLHANPPPSAIRQRLDDQQPVAFTD